MLTIPNSCIRCSRWEGMSLDPWPKGGVLPFPGWVTHFAQVILISKEWKTAAVCCGYHGTAGLLFNFLVFISSHNSFYICCWWCLVTKLCLTLCDSMDCNLPGSSVHGILRARILEWVAISFSRGSSQPRDWTWISCTVQYKFLTNTIYVFLNIKIGHIFNTQKFVTQNKKLRIFLSNWSKNSFLTAT